MTDVQSISCGSIVMGGLFHHDGLGDNSDITIYDEYTDNVLGGVFDFENKDLEITSKGELFPDLLNFEDSSDIPSWIEKFNTIPPLPTDKEQSFAEDILNDGEELSHSSFDICALDTISRSCSPNYEIPERYFVEKDLDAVMAAPLCYSDVSTLLDPIPSASENHNISISLLPISNQQCSPINNKYHERKFTQTLVISGDDNFVYPPSPLTSTDGSSHDADSDLDYTPYTKNSRMTGGSIKKNHPASKRQVNTISNHSDFDSVTTKICRKERKKLQNKNAATRYRDKKREEKQILNAEECSLLLRNKELRTKVNDLSREITYMKNLMDELKQMQNKQTSNLKQ